MSHLFDDAYDDAWRYERFVTTILQKSGISWAKAEQAAQATLQTLAERISEAAARDLAGDLPRDVARWLEPRGATEPFDAVEFVRRVAARAWRPAPPLRGSRPLHVRARVHVQGDRAQ